MKVKKRRRERQIQKTSGSRRAAKEKSKVDWNFEVMDLLGNSGGRKRKHTPNLLAVEKEEETNKIWISLNLETQSDEPTLSIPASPVREAPKLIRPIPTQAKLAVREDILAGSICMFQNIETKNPLQIKQYIYIMFVPKI